MYERSTVQTIMSFEIFGLYLVCLFGVVYGYTFTKMCHAMSGVSSNATALLVLVFLRIMDIFGHWMQVLVWFNCVVSGGWISRIGDLLIMIPLGVDIFVLLVCILGGLLPVEVDVKKSMVKIAK